MAAVAVAGLLASAGCGDDGSSVEGLYKHPEEGTVELKSDGKAVFKQEGSDPVDATYEVEDDTVTITVNDKSITAEVGDDRLTFEPGAYSGDDAEVFEKE